MSPETYAFTAAEAAETVENYISLLCLPEEAARARRYFSSFPFESFLWDVCLTLVLSRTESKAGGPPKFYFQGHIYPRELRAADITPLDRLVEAFRLLEMHLGRGLVYP